MTEPLWRDLTHQEVWDQVHAGPGPYVSDGAATAWINAQSALQQIDSDLDAAIRKAAGWTGVAADATRSGLTPLGGWAMDATGSAGRAAASLTDHQVQVAWVRANLPEPGPTPGIDPPIPLSDAGVDPAVLQKWTVTVGRNTALADHAFHVMDAYAANTTFIQEQAPTWTPPPAVTVSVADSPPPAGPALRPPDRVITFPEKVSPAAAVAGGPQPAGGATVQDGNVVARPPLAEAASTATPTASSSAGPALDSRGSASRDGSVPLVPGPLGVLPGGAAPSARSGAGGLDSSTLPPGTRGPGATPDADGVLRGLPNSAGNGVLRSSPGSGGSQSSPGGGVLSGKPTGPATGYSGSDPSNPGRPDIGKGVLGNQHGDPARPSRGGLWTEPQPTFGDGAASTSAGRPINAGSPGYLPMGGTGLGNRGDTHRRPDYLVGTYSFFTDDRVLAGPLITPEEPRPS